MTLKVLYPIDETMSNATRILILGFLLSPRAWQNDMRAILINGIKAFAVVMNYSDDPHYVDQVCWISTDPYKSLREMKRRMKLGWVEDYPSDELLKTMSPILNGPVTSRWWRDL